MGTGSLGTDQATALPDFSVLCSAYRCEQYLAATIDSVLAQTHPSWELIVVDNGMADEIADIVGRYAHDPRVRLIRQENRKLIGGIATAAAAATGRFLVPLDSDDQLLPGFCARMLEMLDARPDIDVLSCDAYLFRDGERFDLARRFLRHRTSLEHPLTVRDMIGEHDVVPYFAAFRRAAWFAAGGYAPGTELVEDIALFLRLVSSGFDVRVLAEPLTRYRFRDDSASRDPSSIELFDDNREQAYVAAAEATGDPATLEVMARRLRDLRYEREIRRARWTFMQGDVAGARAAARRAYRQRRTARSAAVLVGMHAAPSLLAMVHPAKQYLTRQASRLAAGVAAVPRSLKLR